MIQMMTTTNSSINLILAAAGSSSRLGLGKKKEYLDFEKGTVLSTAAKKFLTNCKISTLVITIPHDGFKEAEKAFFKDPDIKGLIIDTDVIFTEGGETRQDSVLKGLEAVKTSLQKQNLDTQKACVLIHDAARPFVTRQIIIDTVEATQKHGAAVPVVVPVDTQKELNSDGTICRHLVRKNLGAVQTPQGFYLEALIKCHYLAKEQNAECTDDTEIWDKYPEITGNSKVYTVKGDNENKKITYIQDLDLIDYNAATTTVNVSAPGDQMIRIGLGTDLHKLIEGRKLWLGGIEIPSEKGELAHSDGDVLLHAICDALLGASGMGDIGSYFPPEDPQWKDADSKILIKKIWNDVRSHGWKLNNMDCVIEIERPKFLPWRQKVIDSIASILEVNSNLIFVKAKTNEKLDSVGNGEAVKAYCSVLLTK